MSTPSAPARLHVLFAREAPVGVIFRRGPSRQVRLILWRTDTDTFVPGQWLKGRIYEESVSLSPDGTLLAYCSIDYSPRAAQSRVGPGWVAVSQPPYLTAIGLWSTRPAFLASTAFPDSHTLRAWGLGRQHRSVPQWLGVEERIGLEYWEAEPWRSRGWERVRDPAMNRTYFEKSIPGSPCRLRFRRRTRTFTLRDDRIGIEVTPDAAQAEVDPSGRLILARRGKLLAATVAEDLSLIETELADFNDMTFEPIAPPEWARRWP